LSFQLVDGQEEAISMEGCPLPPLNSGISANQWCHATYESSWEGFCQKKFAYQKNFIDSRASASRTESCCYICAV